MRILILNYEFPPLGGGASDVTQALCREYADKGHEVKVITSHHKTLPFYEQVDGYEVFRVRALRRHVEKSNFTQMAGYLISALPRFLAMCLRWKPHAIHSHFLVPTGALAFLGWKIFRIPYIITLHGGDVPSFIPEQTANMFTLIKPLALRFGRKANQIVAVSEDLAILARADYPELASKIISINNGIYVNKAEPQPKFDQPTFLVVGRLSVQKNIAFLINALAKIEEPYRLIILGDGPERTTLERLVVSHYLEDKVHFKGWVSRDEVLDYMQRSHFLVMPSLAEGLPIVGLQAYSTGLPIIGTRVPGLQNLIVHGSTGFLIDSHDQAGLIQTLRRICREPQLSSDMTSHCRDLATTEYAWPKIASQYLSTIKDCT